MIGGSSMRYKEMSDKEIIDVHSGSRLGVLGQTDIEINIQTGQIESFLIPNYKWFGFKKEEQTERIQWNMIEKIGKDIILINTEEN